MAMHMAFFTFLVFALLTFAALAAKSTDGVQVVYKSNSQPRPPKQISHVLVVDRSGQYGQFKSLQKAIDSIASNNQEWVEIRVRAGIYGEKVIIPDDKPYISIIGEGRDVTIVDWWDGGGRQTLDYSTFQVFADNVVVRDITFKNTYQSKLITQAPAALINGDKVAFYGCGFTGVQDTLTDFVGRHYFEGCYIEGYIDFIWGYGQSLYHGCTINITSGPYDDRIYGAGYITAQGRTNKNDETGFVFKYCNVIGTSPAYLGRPYQIYSRLVFYQTYLDDVVVPQGWSSSLTPDHKGSIIHEEVECKGPGSSKSRRVKWGRSLNTQELNQLINPDTFINQDNWIQNQPVSSNYAGKISSVIIVDQSGKGQFTKIQDAVNSIPVNNDKWICIRVRAGIYNERVIIPREKRFIFLKGDGRDITVLQSIGGGQFRSTFSLYASDFVARNIAFKNNHDNSSRKFTQASAILISGDRAAFFECGFISIQDTITDDKGRHYFESCYIQGAVDFIWGDGQSIYHRCTINVTYEVTEVNTVAYITAQARHYANSQTGFVFVECRVVGTRVNLIYLGRAYTEYSRVLFYKSHLEAQIAPPGWLPFNAATKLENVVFAEEGCSGRGADRSQRARWAKRLSQTEVDSLVNVDIYINRDRWLNKLPNGLI